MYEKSFWQDFYSERIISASLLFSEVRNKTKDFILCGEYKIIIFTIKLEIYCNSVKHTLTTHTQISLAQPSFPFQKWNNLDSLPLLRSNLMKNTSNGSIEMTPFPTLITALVCIFVIFRVFKWRGERESKVPELTSKNLFSHFFFISWFIRWYYWARQPASFRYHQGKNSISEQKYEWSFIATPLSFIN